MPGQRETITNAAQARFAHKRPLSNGAGEFASVALRLEPLPRGSGFEFVSEAHKETIPEHFASGVESGVRNAARFGLHGFPVVDLRVVLEDGAYHNLDSTPETFAKAAAEAFRAALKNAGVIILY